MKTTILITTAENRAISLVPLTLSHLPKFYELVRNETITRFMKFDTAQNLDQARDIMQEYLDGVSFLIQTEDGKCMGIFSFKHGTQEHQYTLSAFLHPAYQNKGVMKAVVSFMLPYAKDTLHAELLDAYILSSNIGSCRLVEQSGFTVSQEILLDGCDAVLKVYCKQF